MQNHLANGKQTNNEKITERGRTGMDALGFFIGELEEVLAWETGKELTGVNVRKKADQWLLVLKGRQNGVNYVSFHGGGTILDCYRGLWKKVHTNSIGWAQDKYS